MGAFAERRERNTGRGEWYEYRERPVEFVREVLGVELWAKQAAVVESMTKGRRVVVRSGHKIGKSKLAACVALWWLYCRPEARVVLLAPSARQVRSILWREVRRIHSNAPMALEGTPYDMPDRGLQLSDGREMVGFSTDVAENLAGFSGHSLLFVVDEASGFDENLFDVILGNLAGGGSVLMIGNPTKNSGTFHAAFHDRAQFWILHHISSEETPNVVGNRVIIPGLATRDWVEDMRLEWGEESPLFQVRVRGEFPTQSLNTVIPLELVEAARRRYADWKHGEVFDQTQTLRVGVDPARFGDDESVIFGVRGNVAIGPSVFRNQNSITLAEHVREFCSRYRNAHETPSVRIDEIGIGSGVVDQLKLTPNLSVTGINVSTRASSAQYERLRDQLWFCLRDWLNSGGMIPEDTKLHDDLLGPTFSFSDRNRFLVEDKASMKSRLKRSPDRADALALAVHANFSPSVTLLGPVRLGARRI